MTDQKRPEIKTLANLEAAFAGESMAHIKYRYFARLAREMGDEDTARTFEETADQEVMHAFGHLDLLYPKAGMTLWNTHPRVYLNMATGEARCPYCGTLYRLKAGETVHSAH